MNQLKAQHSNEIQYVASDSDRVGQFYGKNIIFLIFFLLMERKPLDKTDFVETSWCGGVWGLSSVQHQRWGEELSVCISKWEGSVIGDSPFCGGGGG
jgi:hypothetical protein